MRLSRAADLTCCVAYGSLVDDVIEQLSAGQRDAAIVGDRLTHPDVDDRATRTRREWIDA
jgi:hypothetical protein